MVIQGQGPEEMTILRPSSQSVPEILDVENMTFPRTVQLVPDRVAKGKQLTGSQRIRQRNISSTFPSGPMVAAGGCLEWSYVQHLRRRRSVVGNSKTCWYW
jgi:hypothetical protein